VVSIEQRLLKFVTKTNWILFGLASAAGLVWSSYEFAGGIVIGGFIVTANFHLLYRTLRGALTPPYLSSHGVILAKYYLRFIVTGVVIFFLISQHLVNPIGLFVGLSIVVMSIMLATLCEVKKIILKEAL
jgi:hypothetical protein